MTQIDWHKYDPDDPTTFPNVGVQCLVTDCDRKMNVCSHEITSFDLEGTKVYDPHWQDADGVSYDDVIAWTEVTPYAQ